MNCKAISYYFLIQHNTKIKTINSICMTRSAVNHPDSFLTVICNYHQYKYILVTINKT